MNIAYKGKFLREGLQVAGHRIFELELDAGTSLDAAITKAPFAIDFVFLEYFGAFSPVQTLTQVDCPLAVWCIDSPINEFWFKHVAKNADYVFVDQPQSVESLAQTGVHANWLPLPAPPSYFQPERPKEFDLTFIGTIDANRAKRSNLINLIKTKFNIQVLTGVPIPAAQEIFSRSRIILNENFFPGLTLRILQGLSAGAIVFTEKIADHPDYGLKDRRDLIRYNSGNILSLLETTLANYRDYAQIAANGQNACRTLYASENIAARLTGVITAGTQSRRNLDQDRFLWNRLKAEYLHIQRFGGALGRVARQLRDFAASGSEKAPEAHILLGDILARSSRMGEARRSYSAAFAMEPASMATLKLALLDIQQNNLNDALKAIESAGGSSPASNRHSGLLANKGKLDQSLLLTLLAEKYFRLGQKWEMGFSKSFSDPVPDTAFDLARLAWNKSPDERSLEIMLDCLAPWKMQGELLPYLIEGIRRGLLADVLLLETARLAHEYYDPATAAIILKAMKRAR